MRALKFIVIALAVLIVIAMGALVYGFVVRFEKARQPAEAPQEHAAVATAELTSFGTVRETLPPDSEIGTVTLDGNRLMVELLLPDGGVHQIGRASGRERGVQYV